MKSFSIFAAVLLGASVVAVAAESPETVLIPSKKGDITLPHKAHGNSMSCSVCHGETVGKLLPLGMAKGHKMCLDCHKTGGSGPTKCGDCHKK